MKKKLLLLSCVLSAAAFYPMLDCCYPRYSICHAQGDPVEFWGMRGWKENFAGFYYKRDFDGFKDFVEKTRKELDDENFKTFIKDALAWFGRRAIDKNQDFAKYLIETYWKAENYLTFYDKIDVCFEILDNGIGAAHFKRLFENTLPLGLSPTDISLLSEETSPETLKKILAVAAISGNKMIIEYIFTLPQLELNDLPIVFEKVLSCPSLDMEIFCSLYLALRNTGKMDAHLDYFCLDMLRYHWGHTVERFLDCPPSPGMSDRQGSGLPSARDSYLAGMQQYSKLIKFFSSNYCVPRTGCWRLKRLLPFFLCYPAYRSTWLSSAEQLDTGTDVIARDSFAEILDLGLLYKDSYFVPGELADRMDSLPEWLLDIFFNKLTQELISEPETGLETLTYNHKCFFDTAGNRELLFALACKKKRTDIVKCFLDEKIIDFTKAENSPLAAFFLPVEHLIKK